MSKVQELLLERFGDKINGVFIDDTTVDEITDFVEMYTMACLKEASTKAKIDPRSLQIDRRSIYNKENLV